MPEFNSRQVTALAAVPKTKISPFDEGDVKVFLATTPATVTWAQNDTFSLGFRLPKGSRILRSGKVWHGAFGASVTMTVGVRDAVTKTAIDAAGLLASASVATAGLVRNLDTGALVSQVSGYVCLADVEVYATFGGATPTANAQAEFEIHAIVPKP